MNFFAEQDKARRKTKYLVVLFVLAVAALIALTNFVVATILFFEDPELYDKNTFYGISAVVIGSILIAILARWMELSKGGRVVAEGLGGIPLQPNTEDPHERRCQNVVAEMALAANMPVPQVYILHEQISLNAFAAGTTPADAVIGVTRGAVEQFSRDELQGVIAHEFSHILNGDMCLNIRLMAMLRGITFIGDFGQMALYSTRRRSTSRRSDGAALGYALLLIGWLGTIFANGIKSTISRQREFLADASAVQFTRNPHGIADALKLLAGYNRGSAVMNPRSGEASHLFIAPVVHSLFELFATHPPLPVRIRRLEPGWDGQITRRDVTLRVRKDGSHSTLHDSGDRSGSRTIHAPLEEDVMVAVGASIAAGLSGVAVGKKPDMNRAPVDYEPPPIALDENGLPYRLAQQAREPFGALALVYSLLVARGETVRETQYEIVTEAGIKGLELQVKQLTLEMDAMPAEHRLPLLELCLPALKSMSESQYKDFRVRLVQIAKADEVIDLFEWCLYQLVTHYLNPEFNLAKARGSRYRKISEVAAECQLIFSLLAHEGHDDAEEAASAFAHASKFVGLDSLECMAPSDCKVEAFSAAVNKLALCYPLVKPLVLKGLVECIQYNQEVSHAETEIITAIAAAMDCPLPSLDLD